MINKSAILDFINFGFIKPSDTLFSFSEERLNSNVLKFAENYCPIELTHDKVSRKIFSYIEESVDQIVSQGQIDAFAVSGGADSRLILTILHRNHPQFLKSLYIYTRIHPELGPNFDRDYLIAKELSKKIDFELHGELSTIHPQAFLLPQNHKFKKVLTGLWGTELLGGGLLNQYLFRKEDIFKPQSHHSELVDYINNSGVNLQNYHLLEYYLHFNLLMESKMTAFYQSLTWLCPTYNNRNSLSPFLNKDLILLLSSLSPKDLESYRLYSRILTDYCKELSVVPINNSLLTYNLKSGLENWGMEPKGQKIFSNFQQSTTQEQQEIVHFLEEYRDRPYSQYLLSILPYISE